MRMKPTNAMPKMYMRWEKMEQKKKTPAFAPSYESNNQKLGVMLRRMDKKRG